MITMKPPTSLFRVFTARPNVQGVIRGPFLKKMKLYCKINEKRMSSLFAALTLSLHEDNIEMIDRQTAWTPRAGVQSSVRIDRPERKYKNEKLIIHQKELVRLIYFTNVAVAVHMRMNRNVGANEYHLWSDKNIKFRTVQLINSKFMNLRWAKWVLICECELQLKVFWFIDGPLSAININ